MAQIPHYRRCIDSYPLPSHTQNTHSPNRMSLNWFDDDADIIGADSILTGGYKQVVDYLYSQWQGYPNQQLLLSTPVTRVTYYAEDGVTVSVACAFVCALCLMCVWGGGSVGGYCACGRNECQTHIPGGA